MTVFLCLQCWFMISIRLLMYIIIHQVSVLWSHSFAFLETLLIVQLRDCHFACMLCKLACSLLTQLVCTSIYQHDCLLESPNHNIGSAFTRRLIMPEHMLFCEDASLWGREDQCILSTLPHANSAAFTSLAYFIDSTGQQPLHLMFITYEACEHTKATQLPLWPEALLFTALLYIQLHAPYDLASNGTAMYRVC